MIEIEFKGITFDVIGLFHPYEKGDDVIPDYMELIKSDDPMLRKMIGNIMPIVESEGFIRGMKQGLDIYTDTLSKVL